jgi:hypothetical protein
LWFNQIIELIKVALDNIFQRFCCQYPLIIYPGNISVKLIQLVIVQHCVLTMVAGHYNCNVAVLEITDGCPIYPGSIFNQTFNMKPLAQVCKQERGLALDAMLSKEIDETNLASSSLAETGDPNDLLGIVVSYSVKVTLRLSGMGGKLEVDLPFKLNHPKPGKS